jgi:hypothetical protein
MTLIEVKPRKWGWCVFESPGIEPCSCRRIGQLLDREILTRMRVSISIRARESALHTPGSAPILDP